MPLNYLLDSNKRINFLYLFTSVILSIWVYVKIKPKNSFFQYLFNKKIWLSKSAKVDYSFIFFNGFIKVFIIAPFLIFGIYIALDIDRLFYNIFGPSAIHLSELQTIIFFTITITLLGDLLSYIVHYLMHRIPFLWRFHKVHHSATTLNPVPNTEFILSN